MKARLPMSPLGHGAQRFQDDLTEPRSLNERAKVIAGPAARFAWSTDRSRRTMLGANR
jgi:hypothetical protein